MPQKTLSGAGQVAEANNQTHLHSAPPCSRQISNSLSQMTQTHTNHKAQNKWTTESTAVVNLLSISQNRIRSLHSEATCHQKKQMIGLLKSVRGMVHKCTSLSSYS